MGDGDNINENSSSENKKIENFLKRISQNKEKNKPKTPKRQAQTALERKNNYESVCRILEEYLNSYVILGFDTYGGEFVIINAKSDMEKRSISDLMKDFYTGRIIMMQADTNKIHKPLISEDDDDYDDEEEIIEDDDEDDDDVL